MLQYLKNLKNVMVLLYPCDTFKLLAPQILLTLKGLTPQAGANAESRWQRWK